MVGVDVSVVKRVQKQTNGCYLLVSPGTALLGDKIVLAISETMVF